jgi:hypothetical protein
MPCRSLGKCASSGTIPVLMLKFLPLNLEKDVALLAYYSMACQAPKSCGGPQTRGLFSCLRVELSLRIARSLFLAPARLENRRRTAVIAKRNSKRIDTHVRHRTRAVRPPRPSDLTRLRQGARLERIRGEDHHMTLFCRLTAAHALALILCFGVEPMRRCGGASARLHSLAGLRIHATSTQAE